MGCKIKVSKTRLRSLSGVGGISSRKLGQVIFLLLVSFPIIAQESGVSPLEFYQKLKAFELSDSAVLVEQLTVRRDRMEFSFDGTFHLAAPVDGKIYGAVFLGRGRVRVEPMNVYEKDSIQRFLKTDVVEVTFESAVLRFSDNTLEQLTSGTTRTEPPPKKALELVEKLEPRLVKETGLNLSARLAQSVLNQEEPGVFFGKFDGGKPGQFNALLDPQCRVPTMIFNINGGEKGLLWQYRKSIFGNDVWTTFYSEEDFRQGRALYSDAFDLVEISQYRMDFDLRDPGDWLRYSLEIDVKGLQKGVQMIPLSLNEGLSEFESRRLKMGVRVLEATLGDGTPVGVVQEDWETGLTLVLPQPLDNGEKATIRMKLEGKDTLRTWQSQYFYLRMTTTWYPRHGYLNRSNYDLTFRHKKKHRAVSVGDRVQEGPDENNSEEWITRWVTRQPVALVTFALGQFERHTEMTDIGKAKIPVEFYSLPGNIMPVKEDFVQAELGNGLRYFSAMFGDYTYGRLGAAFFPAGFGQGFPTLLMLPVRGHARTGEFAFLSHEGAHQWWGNIVAWRSYRDQWLSEGFAEYSGVLYTGQRQKHQKSLDLIRRLRRRLMDPPRTQTGIAKGKLYEVGPMILGHRLSTRRSLGAYTALIYDKGALVLRMLHFLFTDPATGEGEPFFEMMRNFVSRNRNGSATTEEFFQVASEHIGRTRLGQKYNFKDLNWFLNQWVYQAKMPSYRLEYKIEPGSNGGVVLRGTLYQEGVPDNWFMPLPLLMKFSGKREAFGTIHAFGPATPVEIPLPEKPKDVDLDPHMWVLSAKTETKKIK
jgi:hypothetical protein